MTISYVQNTLNEDGNSGISSPLTTANFGSANTAGNSIIVVGFNSSTTNKFSAVPTDTLGNTYVQVVTPVADAGFGGNIIMWWCPSIKGGSPNAVTMTWTGSVANPAIYALEYSGLTNFDTGQVGDTTSLGGSASVTMQTGNFTTNQVGAIIAVGIPSNSATAPGTNYTQRLITGGFASMLEDWIGAPAGTNDANSNSEPIGTVVDGCW